METTLLKESHENLWLAEGYFLLLWFKEGYVPLRITGREWANLKPYSLGNIAAGGNLPAGWDEIQDGQSRRYFMPYTNSLVYHIFYGVNKPKVRLYVQYPPRENVGNVLTIDRSITGDVGYITGDDSPYEGPYSVKSELFSVKERYPAFEAYNPLTDAMTNVLLSAEYMKYSYEILKDRALVRELVLGLKPARKYTMGRIDPQSMSVPDWLGKLVTSEMLKYTLELVAGGGS